MARAAPFHRAMRVHCGTSGLLLCCPVGWLVGCWLLTHNELIDSHTLGTVFYCCPELHRSRTRPPCRGWPTVKAWWALLFPLQELCVRVCTRHMQTRTQTEMQSFFLRRVNHLSARDSAALPCKLLHHGRRVGLRAKLMYGRGRAPFQVSESSASLESQVASDCHRKLFIIRRMTASWRAAAVTSFHAARRQYQRRTCHETSHGALSLPPTHPLHIDGNRNHRRNRPLCASPAETAALRPRCRRSAPPRQPRQVPLPPRCRTPRTLARAPAPPLQWIPTSQRLRRRPGEPDAEGLFPPHSDTSMAWARRHSVCQFRLRGTAPGVRVASLRKARNRASKGRES